jgi:hypothetical protein
MTKGEGRIAMNRLHYTHGIPKTKESVGPRISLAFRVKPARDPVAEASFYR